MASGLSAPVNIKLGDWGTPIASVVAGAAISWGLVLTFGLLARNAPAWLGMAVTGFATAGFTLVLVHPAALWALESFDLPLWALFAAALVIPTAIGVAARRTALSQWVTGVKSDAARMPSRR